MGSWDRGVVHSWGRGIVGSGSWGRAIVGSLGRGIVGSGNAAPLFGCSKGIKSAALTRGSVVQAKKRIPCTC